MLSVPKIPYQSISKNQIHKFLVGRINDGKESTGVGAPLSRVIFDSLEQKELIRMAPALIDYFMVSDD